MATCKDERQKEEAEAYQRKLEDQRVFGVVMDMLGKPPGLHSASRATNIDGRRYRVNFFQDVDERVYITDSFFIKLGPNDELLYSNPPLFRRYGPGATSDDSAAADSSTGKRAVGTRTTADSCQTEEDN